MRTKLCLLLCLCLSPAVYAETLRLSAPVTQDANTETFGKTLDVSLPKVTLAGLLNDSQNYLGKQVQIDTRIAKVCQKKGCFFIAQQNEHVLRVSFKDYGFFVPTDSSGKTVTLNAELIQKNLSPEQAAHFKSDLKTDSDLVKSGVVYELVATAVRIPRS